MARPEPHAAAEASWLERLLDRRLLVVTGKGGVGKSTVAAVLALAAARRGSSTLLVEIAAREDIPPLLQATPEPSPSGVERLLSPSLWHLSIDPQRTVEQYLREQLPGGALAARLARNHLFATLTAATPGLQELVTIGKVWELARERPKNRYELVILDAPASGHAAAMLATPSTFAAVARVGPVARQARAIASLLADPVSTAVVAVCTPEEMPVSETLQLRSQLAAAPGVGLSALVLNGIVPDRFSVADETRLQATAPSPARNAALFAAGWAREQRLQSERLRRHLGELPCAHLPYLFGGIAGPAALALLALELGA